MADFVLLKELIKSRDPEIQLREEEPMGRHTSFRIGGPVPLMALPKSAEEGVIVAKAAKEAGICPLYLGKGSNLLVADEGIPAFVVKLMGRPQGLYAVGDCGIYAEAGLSLAQVAVFALERGLTGLEFAHGIPGTLGGGVFMNAGAYDGELSQVVVAVDCLTADGQRQRLGPQELEFSYRHSVFSRGDRLILGAEMQLKPGSREEIQGKMEDLMERRKEKQPLEYPSAGSTFKRPPGHFAGALIEGCGLKGARVGGAQVSEKHAGFVVNTGGATCRDVIALMNLVRKTVRKEKGVLLEPEVRLLGCALDETKQEE